MALTAHSTIGEWLDDPTGGPLIRGLFEQTGASPPCSACRCSSSSR